MKEPPSPVVEPSLASALVESVRPSLTKKVGFLLALMWLGAVGALLLFYRHLAHTEAETHFVNVAGRQRMLAQQVLLYAGMSQLGREDDRKALLRVVTDYDAALRAMKEGGAVRGRTLPPPTHAVARALADLAASWSAVKPRLRTALDAPTGAPLALEAFLERKIPELTDAADAVLRTFEAERSARREHALRLFAVGVVVAVLLLGVGLWLTHHFIAKPVRALEAAVRRLSAGDFSQPVVVSTKDELASLARSVNEMSAQLGALTHASDPPREERGAPTRKER